MSNFNSSSNTVSALKTTVDSFPKISRDEISRALIKLGIKSHDDEFEIGPDMDSDTIGAISTAIAGYIQFLSKKNLYRDAIVVDCPANESSEDYLDSIYAVIKSFQDIDRTQKRLEWLSFYGEISYGAYNLHNLAKTLIDHLLVEKDLSSQFYFVFDPQDVFFVENLSDKDMATIASKEKPRIPLYCGNTKHDGIYLARVYRVSMHECKHIYFDYEIESNGVLSHSCFAPKDFVQEDQNIQAGLKAFGFVKDAPKDGDKYTEEEIRKIFDDVKKALGKVNNRVYVLATPKTRYRSELRYIPDLEHSEALSNTPMKHGICVNEFQSDNERDEIARKLSDFMLYAKNNAKELYFDTAQETSLTPSYMEKVKDTFFSLTDIDKAKESLAYMAKHRPGCYTLFDIVNICGCYRCASPKGDFWGRTSNCKFRHNFTAEYEHAKHS